ncbi:MAG: carbamoyl-phosphate synthase large subunit [Fibrobacteres bacterium]|nr:carbamoyl-phosphate synthase large subunit [Fibrobacterota bacterium]
MPKRTDLQKIMLIGSGPIVIGQACEFDYSGTQACKALKEEGYQVVLINSNPATIMTDPGLADATYIEPITWEMCEKIIAKERPDALLPTLGGQTGLNTAVELAKRGILKKYGVEMIGANLEAIEKAESRQQFKVAMEKIGIESARSYVARTIEEAREGKDKIGLPIVVRPAFTLGGAGGGFAYTEEEFERIAASGLQLSPISEILIEESIVGWKEFEMEVMRDKADNVVIICSIENLDAMGIHTGDSITVAPAQTLTDKEYQRMRDASIACIREIGVETGGSNVQFAVNPADGRMIIIEMNPRVSRSSALASKATGFPIAKIAAKLAVGYTLDELLNDITRVTPACFEPTIDYVVTKVPRFTFEKFPQAEPVLGTQMKSVGEAMAIGRTFKESLQKALRSMENDRMGLGADGKKEIPEDQIEANLDYRRPGINRVFSVRRGFELGWSIEKLHDISKIDPWFLNQMRDLVLFEKAELTGKTLAALPKAVLKKAKQWGYSDYQLGFLLKSNEEAVRQRRKADGIIPVFKTVDTCAAEFKAFTPYHYSSYDEENESIRSPRKKVLIVGGGPNRIGQGIEFDYACCQASFALQEEGYESIMVNSNPETVSTDYDTSDKLYFEPLTREDILNIVELERPDGIILQFGGQTPLKLAKPLEAAKAPIIGTSPTSIDIAEDRKLFSDMVERLGFRQPANGIATNTDEAVAIATRLTYPVLIRPSFVLGGRAMMIVYSEDELRKYMATAVEASAERPVLVDKFLDSAMEVDVDAISDGETVVVAGIMQHIEEAGIHSGDSACILPPQDLSPRLLRELERQTIAMAKELKVIGLMNVQYAIKDELVYILEVNPRGSRTVPFVSKTIGVPLTKLATKVMIGRTLVDLGFTESRMPPYVAVKESVFPFAKFHGVDTLLSPEMKSTGEVMGIARGFGVAFAKAQMGAGNSLPRSGKVFISVNNRDKEKVVSLARKLHGFGFEIMATSGTVAVLEANKIPAAVVKKVSEGHPNVAELIARKEFSLIINTPLSKLSKDDDGVIRKAALLAQIPYTTTLSAAEAAVEAIAALREGELDVCSLQEYYRLAGIPEVKGLIQMPVTA